MSQSETTTTPPKRIVVRAIGPKLRKLLYVLAGLLGLLFANSAYLATITFLEWLHKETYQNYFYQCMFLAHLALGLLLIVPFLVFSIIHMRNTFDRKNRKAVKVGYALFVVSLLLLGSGLALFRVQGFEIKQPTTRAVVYWLHVISPLFAVWLYLVHRLAGPKIHWKYGFAYAGAVAVVVAVMAGMHSQDPRKWNVVGPKEGEKYFRPSLARTSTGNFIHSETLMMDDYCKKCHADAHKGWEQSAHHFSSFNNPTYLTSVRETREVAFERDGNVQASRWCAGCHDPVPFFSGAFDDPKFDDVGHATAQAGITCTTCHAITNINSNRGNADYTIEEPVHYPFASSENAFLRWVNNQMVKAKPAFHKKTFLKPLHKTAEFCSSCHKVHLPGELTNYKEFLRGQNHYDAWLLSGVSGHGAKSFYYPPMAQVDCNGCHMPATASSDFGAKILDDSGELKIHDHIFPGANTGIAWLKDRPEAVAQQAKFLQECMRVDIFGIKEGGEIDGTFHAPLRPERPTLKPGQDYLLETVIRTLKLGHLFTQGTVDSNEVWMDVTVKSGDRVIGRSGSLDEMNEVDRWAHFVNVFLLDEKGERINRRNAQDIRVPLYNNQIPPGAGQVVHYRLEVPEDVEDHITVEVKLQYRKFDQEYMAIVAKLQKPGDLPLRGYTPGEPYRNPLPIVTMAVDTITLPVEGIDRPLPDMEERGVDEWQRWNDYGIGLLLEGKAELKQAEHAFQQVELAGRYDGPLNLTRVYQVEGRLDEAVAALDRAAKHTDPAAPPWTMSWLAGVVNSQQGHLEEAEENLKSVLETQVPSRKFDFSRDYTVRNELGIVQLQLAQRVRGDDRADERQQRLERAVATFEETLKIDSENVTAHYNLELLHRQLGNTELAEKHGELHRKYKMDDTIQGQVVQKARERYPAADHAAEALVIYSLTPKAEEPEEPKEKVVLESSR
ncbi:MAG: multiheme c-type cytochrome [Planctomycetaceae bacterium]